MPLDELKCPKPCVPKSTGPRPDVTLMQNGYVIPMSSEAESWIAEKIRLEPRGSYRGRCIPVLGRILNYSLTDRNGASVEASDGGFVDIVWYPVADLDVMLAGGCRRAEIRGRAVCVAPDLIDELDGGSLVLSAALFNCVSERVVVAAGRS